MIACLPNRFLFLLPVACAKRKPMMHMHVQSIVKFHTFCGHANENDEIDIFCTLYLKNWIVSKLKFIQKSIWKYK